jgi:hypothetical protein
MTDVELLKACVAHSGLSVRRFALEVVGREDRTVRRWMAGQPIPKAAKAFLVTYLQSARV